MKHLVFHSRARDPDGQTLSNFFPCLLEVDGHRFTSIEAAFQAFKYRFSTRPELFAKLSGVEAKTARRMGSKTGMMRNGAVLDVERWNAASEEVMRSLVQLRLLTDPAYASVLRKAREEGTVLLHFERSGALSRWGGSFSRKDRKVFQGNNLLGKILMSVTL